MIVEFSKAVNMSYIKDINSVNTGYKNGLRFVLNTVQKQHCDVSNKYSGAGFHVAIHEPNDFRQFFSLSPSIYLKPGSVINVLLKPTAFTRRNSNFGVCKKPVYVNNHLKMY